MRNMPPNILSRSYRGVSRTGLSRKLEVGSRLIERGGGGGGARRGVWMGANEEHFCGLIIFFPLPLSNKIRRHHQRVFHSTGLYLKASMRILQEHAQWMLFFGCWGVYSTPLLCVCPPPAPPPSSICTIPSLHIRKQESIQIGNLKYTHTHPPAEKKNQPKPTPTFRIVVFTQNTCTTSPTASFGISLSWKTLRCFRTLREKKGVVERGG